MYQLCVSHFVLGKISVDNINESTKQETSNWINTNVRGAMLLSCSEVLVSISLIMNVFKQWVKYHSATNKAAIKLEWNNSNMSEWEQQISKYKS